MNIPAADLRTSSRRDPASARARQLWLLAAAMAVLAFVPGAVAYYHKLLVDPFFGSTVTPNLARPADLPLAFSQLGLSATLYAAIPLAREVIVALGCLSLGALVGLRATDRGAWLISILLILSGTLVPVNGTALSQSGPAWSLLGYTLNAAGSLTSLSLVLLFPDGRFALAWMRWVWLALVAFTLATSSPRGPLSIVLGGNPALRTLAILIVLAPVVISPIYRYLRTSGPIQRHQIKWVALALAAGGPAWAIGGLVIPGLLPVVTRSLPAALAYNLIRTTFQDAVSFLIPLTIALSIRRYRLWDIDLIIRRTLIYSLLAGLLALAYFGSVVALESMFRGLTGQGQSQLVTVVSTLAIAALFVPLRRRVQAFIDRRFYRRKYDAARTLAAFGATLRDEVELDKLSEHLVGVVDAAMQPASVSLWLKPSGPARRGKE